MRRLIFSLAILLLNYSSFGQTPVIAGVVPPGFHLDTPSVNMIQVLNCFSPIDSMKINFDQSDTINDVVLKIEPLCSSFSRSQASYLVQNPEYSFACGPCPNSFLPILYPVELGQSFSNLWYQPNYCGLGILNSSGTFISGSCNNQFGLCGIMRFVIVRKKIGNELFYGWMDITSCPSSSAQLNFKVHSLTLFPKIMVMYDTISCQNTYTFPDGFTMNNIVQDTCYDAVLSSSNPNCDSLVRTRLHVLPIVPSYLVQYDTSCDHQPYIFPNGDSIYLVGGSNDYTCHDTSMLLSQVGCDSINIVTHLYVRHVENGGYHTVNVCPNSNYTFPDGMVLTNVTQNTQHTNHFIGANGCDSTATTILHIAATYSLYQSLSICVGDSIVVGSHIYSTTGIYVDTLQTISGCDSVITTQLAIAPNYSMTQSYSLCSGDSVIVGNHVYLVSGNYMDTLQSNSGCDSIITTLLTVVPINSISQSLSICAGDSVVVGNHVYLASGNYVDTLQAISSCDSIIYTHLTVMQPGTAYDLVHVCPLSGYTFPDATQLNNITQDTLQISHVIGTNGCDSIIHTQISVVYIDTALALNGNILSSNNITQANYQWIDCSSNTIITGATSQNFAMTSAGAYAVIVNLYGCIDTSICFFSTDVTNTEVGNEIYFTNPVTDRIRIHGSNDDEKFLLSSLGQILFRTRANVIHVENLPQGIYFMRIRDHVWKVVKQ